MVSQSASTVDRMNLWTRGVEACLSTPPVRSLGGTTRGKYGQVFEKQQRVRPTISDPILMQLLLKLPDISIRNWLGKLAYGR
jgi:hypothetical protein